MSCSIVDIVEQDHGTIMHPVTGSTMKDEHCSSLHNPGRKRLQESPKLVTPLCGEDILDNVSLSAMDKKVDRHLLIPTLATPELESEATERDASIKEKMMIKNELSFLEGVATLERNPPSCLDTMLELDFLSPMSLSLPTSSPSSAMMMSPSPASILSPDNLVILTDFGDFLETSDDDDMSTEEQYKNNSRPLPRFRLQRREESNCFSCEEMFTKEFKHTFLSARP